MKKMLAVVILMSVATWAHAQVLEVNIWKPLPGKGQQTFQNAQKARAIQEKLGANVNIARDFEGRLHYAIRFDSWSAWAKFGAKVDASKEWADFWTSVTKDPGAELESNYLLNAVSAGAVGKVYQVYIWQPIDGRLNDLVEAGGEAEKIHEKAGVKVNVLVDQLNRLHYVMNWESWDDWGKFQDTPNPEFSAWFAELNKDAPGELIQVYTASSL